MKPLVSVLIPMYNEEHGIRKTLNSILAQTYSNYEIIVVDDGSTDRSAEIVRTEYPQANLIQQENQGIAVALNTGLAHCKGEYIARIDCNDEAYPTRLEKQVKALSGDPDLAVVGGHIMLYEKDGNDLGICKFPTDHQEIRFDLLRGNSSLSHVTTLIRKSILAQLGGYDPFYTGKEDFELWCRISLVAKLGNLDILATRTLSTTVGISFKGIQLKSLIELALLEREERIVNGIHWKNEQLRDKYKSEINAIKKRPLTDEQIKINTIRLYNRRARFLFLSGERKGARQEFKRGITYDKFNLSAWFGYLLTFIMPYKLFEIIYRPYRNFKYFKYNMKLRNSNK